MQMRNTKNGKTKQKEPEPQDSLREQNCPNSSGELISDDGREKNIYLTSIVVIFRSFITTADSYTDQYRNYEIQIGCYYLKN